MIYYFLYFSHGPKLPWQLLRDRENRIIVHLSAELVSVKMMQLKVANPTLDYMFFQTTVESDPPETLVRRCGCGGNKNN
jgi:hypothetical protein